MGSLESVLPQSSGSLPRPLSLQRMLRMRAWRQHLAPEEQEEWVRSGAAGPALRSFRGRPANWRLEEELVRGEEGTWGC